MRPFLLALCTILLAGQAQAHAQLQRAEPRVGSTTATAPKALRLWFSEGVEPAFSRVVLIRADGRAVPVGRLSIDPGDRALVIVPVLAPLAAGSYRVRWRVISVDSHTTQGEFVFTVRPR
ncbi:MAG TPA: copper homeostasis periplasmic binding protein CopC [Caulobacteraceae bacterium]|nr:copper homeostasis periplasmic binding protein CopC [Caulobacteraceae bacterium]